MLNDDHVDSEAQLGDLRGNKQDRGMFPVLGELTCPECAG